MANHCSKCNKKFPDKDNYCDECGTKLSAKASKHHVRTKEGSENRLKMKWFVTFSFILSIISALVAMVLLSLSTGLVSVSQTRIILLLYFTFLIPVIPIISLICNIVSLKLARNNNSLGKMWKVVLGIVLSSVSILPGLYVIRIWF